jgi:hypothetical protein
LTVAEQRDEARDDSDQADRRMKRAKGRQSKHFVLLKASVGVRY